MIYVKNTMKYFYKSLYYHVLVPVQYISVSWTLAAQLVFLSYVCCVQNPFEASEIAENDE